MSLRRSRLVIAAAALLAGAAAAPALALPGLSTSALTPDLPLVDDGRCDPIDPAHCLLPFPNNFFTVPDDSTDTGLRVNFDPLSMPRNVASKPILPTEWNRNDGFSPGATVLTYVPGLDLHQTWGTTKDVFPEPHRDSRDQIADLSRTRKKDAPIVIIDADTGKRFPFWSEMDTHPDTTDDRRLLILRPAVNFEEGHRYIVALRNLKDAAGNEIARTPAFDAFVNRTAKGARASQMEDIFRRLESATPHPIDRDELYLAWDFTIASERNLTERALSIRDEAFAQLGDENLADRKVEGSSPQFAVTSVEDRERDRRIEGTVTVPNFILPQVSVQADIPDPIGVKGEMFVPGSRFYDDPLDEDTLPDVNPLQPTIDVGWVCTVPKVEGGAYPMLYGHGLLGSRDESTGSSTHDLRQRGFAPCAVDWMGMAFSDILNVATILADVSSFASLADRGQQGFLNFMFLGRALLHPEGLVSDPAFRSPDGQPLLRTGELYYDGNSQGGIMGGSLTALSPDFTRAVLGVPGMNYSTLLNRSVDWEGAYGEVLYLAYPDKLEQQLIFGLIQMLWDRAESNGYAHHITDDPLANTPPHQVMLQVAFGDHQVTNVSAEVMGRTVGAKLKWPALAADQHWSVDPMFGFEPSTYGVPGDSHLVYWYSADRGNVTPPNGNIPSTSGGDPHGDPRKDYFGTNQEAAFLLHGILIDVCNGGPCVTTQQTRDM